MTPPEMPDSVRNPRQRRRGRDRVKGLIKRLQDRSRARKGMLGRRMRRRKAALALSAGVMGFNTGAAFPENGQPAFSVAIDQRLPAALLRVSGSLKRAMIEEEGVRYTVYRDVAGHPTVGVGHLVTPADGLAVGDRISPGRVLDFLEQDLQIAEAGVARLVGKLPLYQYEFDALVDLVFNVGEGNVSAQNSPRLNAAIDSGDYYAMAEELGYTFAGDAVAAGLVHRSERRENIFTLASYDNTRPGAPEFPSGSI
ncbi:lysozyme [Tsuneonella sp. HG222]